MAHAWPCPTSVGHTTCTCEGPRHRAEPRNGGLEVTVATVAVLAVLASYLVLVGVLS